MPACHGADVTPPFTLYSLFCLLPLPSPADLSLQLPDPPGGLPTQIGNKTECAMLGFVIDLGVDYRQMRREMPDTRFKKVYTFNSARKSMSTIIPLDSGGFRCVLSAFARGQTSI